MALMSYLLKDRHGTYYFRRVVPPGLRPFMPEPWAGKVEWKRTLKTKKPPEAKVRAARALSDCTADLQAAERAKRGEPAIIPATTRFDAALLSELEVGALRSVLAADEAERTDGDDRRHLQTPGDREQFPLLEPVAFGRKGMADDHFEALGDALPELAADFKKALARQNPSIVSAELRMALRPLDLLGKLTSDEEHEAGLAVLKGTVRAYDLLLKRQDGEVVETPKPSADKGPKLSEAFDAWKQGGGARGSKKPAGRTLDSAQHAVRRFTEWHGDMRLGDITRGKAREFRDALKAVPTHLKHSEQKLSLREILKRPAEPGREVHAATVNKAMQLLGGIVSHAMAAGSVDDVPGFTNPFGKGIKIPIDKRLEENREPFAASDLQAIFGTAVFTGDERPVGGGAEAAYWLPVIALITGARQTEIAQQRIMDLRQDPESGIWHFDITMDGGGSVKTPSSIRKVPVHSALIRIGLLRYRQHLLDAGASEHSKLWPGVKADSGDQQAGPWSKWFHRELRKLGITDRRKVFHSFRHTFKRYVRGLIDEDASHAISGHAADDNEGSKYGRGFELTKLAAIVETIPTPPVLASLEWQPGKVRPVAKQKRPRPPQHREGAGSVPRGRGGHEICRRGNEKPGT